MNLFDSPPSTKWNFLSLGAGVQSSTLALMAAQGEVKPMPDAAIFADTQAEPTKVYDYLEWLKQELPYEVHIVTKGDLKKDSVKIRTAKKGHQYVESMVPAFTVDRKGKKGMIQRQCTKNYKVVPVSRKIRQLAEVARGTKTVMATQWIGISLDEVQRMKDSREKWLQSRWPLIEKGMTRQDCLSWMKKHGYPEPPRSACVFCPYMKDPQWKKLQESEPESFEVAVEFEKEYNTAKKTAGGGTMENLFLHSSCVPLDQVDFSTDFDHGQLALWQDFNNDCDGMCGV